MYFARLIRPLWKDKITKPGCAFRLFSLVMYVLIFVLVLSVFKS